MLLGLGVGALFGYIRAPTYEGRDLSKLSSGKDQEVVDEIDTPVGKVSQCLLSPFQRNTEDISLSSSVKNLLSTTMTVVNVPSNVVVAKQSALAVSNISSSFSHHSSDIEVGDSENNMISIRSLSSVDLSCRTNPRKKRTFRNEKMISKSPSHASVAPVFFDEHLPQHDIELGSLLVDLEKQNESLIDDEDRKQFEERWEYVTATI